MSSAASWPLWVVGAVALQLVVSATRAPPGPTARQTTHQRRHLLHFPPRSALHLQRKAQHVLTGLFFYAAAGVLPIDVAGSVLLLAALAFLGLHHLRGASPRVNALYIASFRSILRHDEAKRRVLPGAFYFLLGVALAAALFPVRVTRLALLHVRLKRRLAVWWCVSTRLVGLDRNGLQKPLTDGCMVCGWYLVLH